MAKKTRMRFYYYQVACVNVGGKSSDSDGLFDMGKFTEVKRCAIVEP